MRIVLLAIVLFLLIPLKISAQRNCGTTEYMQDQLLLHPEWQKNLDSIESFTQEFIQNPAAHDRTVITIPVVVHVLWNTAAQNITDAQIQSQIEALNRDFRKQNTDWSQTPFQWLPLVADCEINFCLASRDIYGNPTNGIERRQTSMTSFCGNDAVKYTAKGGLNAWTASQYLNIWVCNLQGNLLGYAQFPGGPPASDGVVLDYQYTGTTGTATSPYDKGRTATHEVGHWLNLYHIWGGNEVTCTDDDRCSDTPVQETATAGCPFTAQQSCSNGPYGNMYRFT